MAEVAFVNVPFNGNGKLWRATPLATGDTTSVLKIVQGNADVSVQVYGTIGGATVTIEGSLVGTTFGTVDDAYGVAMSYTAISAIPKPVGPGITALRGAVASGSSVAVSIDVYVIDKVR